MLILDRYIATRLLINFVVLFAIVFLFGISIDLVLNLDNFLGKASEMNGDDSGLVAKFFTGSWLAINFYSPMVFQFYAYLYGLALIGAIGFTLTQLVRNRELIAILASGLSLHRISFPILGVAFLLCILQILNQELMLPRVAPLLLRGHASLGKESVSDFIVPFTPDEAGNLLLASGFSPESGMLSLPTVLVRNVDGQTVRRISADSASWDEERHGWVFEKGRVIDFDLSGEDEWLPEPGASKIEFYATDLSPRALTAREYGHYLGMLSMGQLSEMLDAGGGADKATINRFWYSRFSGVFVTLLVIIICLPFFLLRLPGDLLLKSVLCAGTAVPLMLGMTIVMIAPLPGLGPLQSAFLPVIVLIPIALWRIGHIQT